jgi:hypothetical protein
MYKQEVLTDGKLVSTFDLLAQTSSDQLILIVKPYIS